MTLLSRVMGLIREMTRARFLGTSASADAFSIAFMLPNLLRRLFAENSISVAFIPTFTEYLQKIKSEKERIKEEVQKDGGKDKEKVKKIINTPLKMPGETQEFISATLTLISFLTAFVVVIGIAASPVIVRLFYKSNVEQAVITETALLTRLMFPYLFVISVAAFFQGLLNGCKIFTPSGFTPVLFNLIVVIVTYTLTPQLMERSDLPKEVLAARAMSFGVITGGCFQVLFQWPFVKKTGWKTTITSIKKAFTNTGTRRVIGLVAPTILGMAAYQLNDLTSTAIAGRMGTGIVSALQYSLRLQELILGIFVVSISTVILPTLASYDTNKEYKKFNDLLLQTLKIIALITIPVTFYAIIAGKDIIKLVYMSRSFNEESVDLTYKMFFFHIIGLFFIGVNRVVTQAFYAQKNTALPTLAGILCFIVNIIAVFILSHFMGGEGVALALSVASVFNTATLFVFMGKLPSIKEGKKERREGKESKIGGEEGSVILLPLLLYVVRIVCFSLIALCPTHFLMLYLKSTIGKVGNKLISSGGVLLISATAFALIGITLLFIFKDEILVSALGKIRGRGGKESGK